jgi:hypothetical protein
LNFSVFVETDEFFRFDCSCFCGCSFVLIIVKKSDFYQPSHVHIETRKIIVSENIRWMKLIRISRMFIIMWKTWKMLIQMKTEKSFYLFTRIQITLSFCSIFQRLFIWNSQKYSNLCNCDVITISSPTRVMTSPRKTLICIHQISRK